MTGGYEPIRKYQKKKQPGKYENLWVILLILVVAVGCVMFAMSLSGTGLFRNRTPETVPPDSTDTAYNSETETTEEISTENPDIHRMPTDIEFSELNLNNEDVHRGNLVLVDNDHPFVFPENWKFYDADASFPDTPWEEIEDKKNYIVSIYNVSHKGYSPSTSKQMLRLDVIMALNRMMESYSTKKDDYTGVVSSSYRSYSDQAAIYAESPELAAMPGCSDYHTGATFVLKSYVNEKLYDLLTTTKGVWIKVNCCNYGFIMRYPSYAVEYTGYNIPSQLRYIGVPHATYIANNGMCLEQYLESLRTNNVGMETPLFITSTTDGFDYLVYYTPASSEGNTAVPVPANREYTVSGDNIGGFIVTITVERETN